MAIKQKETILFSWLHLSDIHFLHGNEKAHIDQELILNAIIKDINNVKQDSNLGIPLPIALFVTGDIAFSGNVSHSNEYEKAGVWINKIKDEICIKDENIYLVPGNHDVQRNIDKNDDVISMLMELLRSKKRDLEWALSNPEHYSRLAKRFENYLNFIKDIFPLCSDKTSELKLYWNNKICLNSGFKINLLGLNTALLSQNDDDKGKLCLSLNQIKDYPDFSSNNELSIALGHHPFSWLSDGVESERWLRKKIHIYLSGHIHDPGSFSYHTGGGSSLITVQAGAVHCKESMPNSYNYAAVVKNSSGELFLRIWNKIWSHKNKDFRDDSESFSPGKAYSEHILPIKDNTALIIDGSCTLAQPEIHTKNEKFKPSYDYISDFPPVVDCWVGRKSEISALNRVKSGIVTITGIGGQGKSALASKYLDLWTQNNEACFWDWRDCREQGEQFRTKLVAIIEHFTQGEVLGHTLEGASIKELVRFFFETVKDEKGIIVLDNIDHYVDLSKNNFSYGVSDFIDGALQYSHNFLIILTCRPRINYASPRFIEIFLEGISLEEAKRLFELRKSFTDFEASYHNIARIHNLTEGHPLWLNLIATQISTETTTFDEIIIELEEGGVDNRAKTMLRSVWKGLNSRQEIILRSMAELIRPVEIEWIYDCTRNKIKSWNQFSRTFRSLQSLSMIVESRGKFKEKEFDLHPIIRNFVRTEFHSMKDREPFLDRVIYVIESFFCKRGKSITFLTPINHLEKLVMKAELELRRRNFPDAIKTLVEVGDNLVQRGMPGDLFRIGEELLSICEETHESLLEMDEFHRLNILMGYTYAEYGRKTKARALIKRYERVISGKTAYYISLCDLRCYVEWLFENYEEAILWGDKGVHIKKKSDIDTQYDSAHSLALAQRDSGNVDEALKYFLGGLKLQDILSKDVNLEKKESSFFGNIGRCLQIKEQLDNALICLVKSAFILKNNHRSIDILNRGYAALWIGEILEKQGDFPNAYLCYRQSKIIWTKRAPIKNKVSEERLTCLLDKDSKLIEQKNSDTDITRKYEKWIEEHLPN